MEGNMIIGTNKTSPSRGHIKRPMNSFMVWSREKRCEILKKHPGINNAVVSKTLGAAWKSLTEDEKKPYIYEAQRLAEQHRDAHPEYKYRPRRRKSRMKTNELIEEPQPNLIHPTHRHHYHHHQAASNNCMCRANVSPPRNYPPTPATTAVASSPSQFHHSPSYYNYVQPSCCSTVPGERPIRHGREKSSLQELLEQQELLRIKQSHYSAHDLRYRDYYKTPCTRGCCSPTDDYVRYYKYTPYHRHETLPY
eukprot:gene12208-13466_t